VVVYQCGVKGLVAVVLLHWARDLVVVVHQFGVQGLVAVVLLHWARDLRVAAASAVLLVV
jgi:hypothetical protein